MDPKVIELVERFIGIAIRAVPTLAAAGASIADLINRDTELTDAERAMHRANLDEADKALGGAIEQRLGPDNAPDAA